MLRSISILLLAVLLTACGDKDNEDVLTRDASGLPGMGGTMPDADELSKMMTDSGKIELTDEMMERYVKLMESLKEVDTPSEALLARFRFDLRQWAALNALIWGSQSRVALDDSRASLEKALAEAREEAKTATGAKKQMAESKVQAYETQLSNLGSIAGASEVDRKNVEVLKRWKDRLEAIHKNR